MPPKRINYTSSYSKNRKASDLVPDMEDLGEMLKASSARQGTKSDRCQPSDGKDYQTCGKCDTQASGSSKEVHK